MSESPIPDAVGNVGINVNQAEDIRQRVVTAIAQLINEAIAADRASGVLDQTASGVAVEETTERVDEGLRIIPMDLPWDRIRPRRRRDLAPVLRSRSLEFSSLLRPYRSFLPRDRSDSLSWPPNDCQDRTPPLDILGLPEPQTPFASYGQPRALFEDLSLLGGRHLEIDPVKPRFGHDLNPLDIPLEAGLGWRRARSSRVMRKLLSEWENLAPVTILGLGFFPGTGQHSDEKVVNYGNDGTNDG